MEIFSLIILFINFQLYFFETFPGKSVSFACWVNYVKLSSPTELSLGRPSAEK